MNFVMLTGLLCCLVAATAAVFSRGFYIDPDHPGKCVVEGLVLSPGEIAQQASRCGQMLCDSDGSVDFHSCDVDIPPPGYKLGDPIMPTADYPDCCRKAYLKMS